MPDDNLTFDERIRLAIARKHERARRAVGFPTETDEPTPGGPHVHAGEGNATQPRLKPTFDDLLRERIGRI